MFTTLKQKLLLAGFVILVISIPVGSYLLSERQTVTSKASEKIDRSILNLKPLQEVSPAGELKKLSEQTSTLPVPTPSSSISYGPTLNFKISLEGRPQNKMATKLFVGIAEGKPAGTPSYLLQFNVDLPESGSFEGLSLAGLTPNNQYTAFLKSPAQIATSSAFLMVPTTTTLNNGNPINLTTGDLNEDNLINSADYVIAKSALGASPGSPNWNSLVDFNLDNIINSLDLGIILKNMSKTGETGVWVSPTPQGSATSSGSPAPSGAGYWLWLPQI